MGAPQPILGYESKTAAVYGLRSEGRTTKEIANLLDIGEAAVTALEISGMRGKKRQERPAETFGRTVLFPSDILDALGPHAAQRGITANELARRIVSTVVDEKMVDAVLDDADERDL